MTAAELGLIASYVCPWGTILVLAVAFAWTVHRLSSDGVFHAMFEPRTPQPVYLSSHPIRPPSRASPSPAIHLAPSGQTEELALEEDTGEIVPRTGGP